MKIIASRHIVAVFSPSPCGGSGGHFPWAECGEDHSFYKTGLGLEHVGRMIENKA